MENNEQIFIMNHPLIQHKLSFLRDKNTGTKEFRELVSEIATLMCYEATRDLPLMDVQTETPMCTATTKVIAGRKLAFVPILRAGLGMVDGMLQLVPSAKVGHIGLYRDHDTLQPVCRPTLKSVMSSCLTRCSRPAVPQWTRSPL